MAQILWEPTNALNPPTDSWCSYFQQLQAQATSPTPTYRDPIPETIWSSHSNPAMVQFQGKWPWCTQYLRFGGEMESSFQNPPGGYHLDVSSESTGVVSSPWLDLPDFCDHLEGNRWRTIINSRFFHFSLAILEPGRPSLPRTNPAAYPLPFQAQKLPCGGAARFSS